MVLRNLLGLEINLERLPRRVDVSASGIEGIKTVEYELDVSILYILQY